MHVSVATSPVQHSMILVTLTILKSNIVQKNHAYGLSCGDPRTRALFAASMRDLPNLPLPLLPPSLLLAAASLKWDKLKRAKHTKVESRARARRGARRMRELPQQFSPRTLPSLPPSLPPRGELIPPPEPEPQSPTSNPMCILAAAISRLLAWAKVCGRTRTTGWVYEFQTSTHFPRPLTSSQTSKSTCFPLVLLLRFTKTDHTCLFEHSVLRWAKSERIPFGPRAAYLEYEQRADEDADGSIVPSFLPPQIPAFLNVVAVVLPNARLHS